MLGPIKPNMTPSGPATIWDTATAEQKAAANAAIGQVEFPVPTLPKDAQGFVQSFEFNDAAGIQAFFDQYGFVVVRDVLDPAAIVATVEEIWSEIERKLHSYETVSRNDTGTWEDGFWPKFMASKGLLGGDISIGKQAFHNRLNDRMYDVFCQLYKHTDLWVSIDRYGIMRPTKQVPKGKLKPVAHRVGVSAEAAIDTAAALEDKPHWKTDRLWLHWDLNPWKWTGTTEGLDYQFEHLIIENNGSRNASGHDLKLQGLIALVDSHEEDGGFCCVPGFHKHLKEWATATMFSDAAKKNHNVFDFVSVPDNDKIHTQSVPITMRAGSLVIWSSELPHCNFPNNSSNFRMNQYVKMFPNAENAGPHAHLPQRYATVEAAIPKNFPLRQRDRKLLGLDSWYNDESSSCSTM